MGKEKSGDFTNYTQFHPEEYKPKVENGVILEIGPGIICAFTFSEEILSRLKNNTVYVALDDSRDCLPSIREALGDHRVVGDLIDLPIRSGSAEQVWLMNVFGAGDRTDRSAYFGDNYELYESELYDRFFSELARVLKPGGMVIIGEYNTPAEWLLDKDFKDFGLDKKIFIEKEDLEEFLRKHGITTYVANQFRRRQMETWPFFIILTKIETITS